MKTEKIVKELVRRGLEFRGEITKEQALELKLISNAEIEYACKKYECENLLYFAKRVAPENGKIGDSGTDCKDILITVDTTNDDSRSHYVMKDSWFIPYLYSEEHPEGVWSLEVGEDCKIKNCSHHCGCTSTTAYSFNKYWKYGYNYDNICNSFDAVAGNKGTMGFLSETCTPIER